MDPDDDGHDGVGALTGALDQLAFNDEDEGDGDDETWRPGGRRPELAAAERARLEAEKLAKEEEDRKIARKAKLEGINNRAFVDDDELLLASGLIDEDKLTTPRVVVEASTTVTTVGAGSQSSGIKSGNKVEPLQKGKIVPMPASDIGVFTDVRSRPVSARKRLGSAKKNIPRFTMTFSDLAPLAPISSNKKERRKSLHKHHRSKDSIEKIKEDERKTRRNQVSPSASADGETNIECTIEDPEKSKPGPADKMKNWSTGEVGNINSILPWDNDNGDII